MAPIRIGDSIRNFFGKAAVQETVIENINKEKQLGTKFDTIFSFESQISSLCKKAS